MNDLYKKLLDEVSEEHQQNLDSSLNSRVLLIDGLNTFFRAWSVNPTMDDNGDHIGGITGFLKSIGYGIREYKATRCIIIFDGKGSSNKRKQLFSNYKSDRGKNRFRVNRQYEDMMSEEDEQESMKRQIIGLIELLEYLPVDIMLYDSIEADDVIGYIASQIVDKDKGENAIIMSSDKDFLQLVKENVKVYAPSKKKTYTEELIKEEYGIDSSNFVLFRCLDGDNSDSINGVNGCGLKTVIKRFPEFVEKKNLKIKDLYDMCEERSTGAKVYSEILKSKTIVERNYKLMQLSDPEIPSNTKMKILSKYLENTKKLDKLGFIKKATGMRIIGSLGDVNSWIQNTFSDLTKYNK